MPFITQQKTNWKFLLIVAVLAAVVGGGILWSLQQIPSSQPLEIKIPEKVKDETANWKTYRNEEYGFEFKYPKDYNIREETVTDRLTKIRILSPEKTVEFGTNQYTTNNIRIDINIYNNPNSLQLNQWLGGISETDSGPTFDAKYRRVISINGIEGVQWYSGCCGGCEEDVYIRGDKIIYNFALEGGTPGGSELCEGDVCKECDTCCFSVSGEVESIFNQMLSTFRFLE